MVRGIRGGPENRSLFAVHEEKQCTVGLLVCIKSENRQDRPAVEGLRGAYFGREARKERVNGKWRGREFPLKSM